MAAGYTYNVTSTYTYTSSGWTGTIKTDVTTDDGGTYYTCDQTVSATM